MKKKKKEYKSAWTKRTKERQTLGKEQHNGQKQNDKQLPRIKEKIKRTDNAIKK